MSELTVATGLFKSGTREGKRWYKVNGKFAKKEDYDAAKGQGAKKAPSKARGKGTGKTDAQACYEKNKSARARKRCVAERHATRVEAGCKAAKKKGQRLGPKCADYA